ncbi:MAG: hypothetical protein K9H84_00345 [Bacteroidales bacterium]|nr:hypothetical protein [Bacteroidales bacterium]
MVNKIYIILLLIGIFLSGCVPEKRLARNFVENTPNTGFLVMTPDIILKESLKPVQDTTLENLSQRQKDSVRFMESEFIQYIPDSFFLNLYLPEFKKEVRKLGLNVYFNTPKETFFTDTNLNAYIFNMAQIQLQEFSEQYFAKETYNSNLYFQELILDGLHINTWVEFQKVNSSDQKPMVLFSELTARDEVDGHFHQNQFTGEVQYTYKIDSLDFDKVRQTIKNAGRIHAGYMFDFLMNQYVKANMSHDGLKTKYYLHYNRTEDELESVYEQRFIIQKQ